MRVFLLGGTGVIGSRLIQRSKALGDEIVLLTRRPDVARAKWATACTIVEGNPMEAGAWMKAVDDCDAVINLVGEGIFARRWNAEFMKLLIDSGADPKIATKAGDTALMAAAGIGWAANWSVNAPVPAVEAVKYCVELGIDVNAADNRGYTALHGAAYLGNNDMVNYLVSKGARVDAKSKAGDTVADLANGPTRFGQPHLETVALLEKLGSANSHNCRSDQCVVAARATVYERPLLPGEQAEKDALDKFAAAMGFQSAIYLADIPAGRVFPGGK